MQYISKSPAPRLRIEKTEQAMTTQQESKKSPSSLSIMGSTPPQGRAVSWLPMRGMPPLGWRYSQPPLPEELAHELLGLAEFRTLQLGTWLDTTDGQIIAKAVEAVVPAYLSP